MVLDLKVDVKNVIASNLRAGETFNSVVNSLHNLAFEHMKRDFAGLKRDLYLDSNLTQRELVEQLKSSKKLKSKFNDIKIDHVYGYIGEIAVHAALRRDWHLVYEANDIEQFSIPDGYVDGHSYDVKSKHKDDANLSVAEAKIKWDFYILVHLKHVSERGGYADIVGYSTKEALLNGRLFHYRDGTAARAPLKLQSFEEFLARFLK